VGEIVDGIGNQVGGHWHGFLELAPYVVGKGFTEKR